MITITLKFKSKTIEEMQLFTFCGIGRSYSRKNLNRRILTLTYICEDLNTTAQDVLHDEISPNEMDYYQIELIETNIN